MKIALLVVVLSGCATTSPSQPTPTPIVWPDHVAVGQTAPATMITHCGVRPFLLNGTYWHMVDPGPLEQADYGTITLIDESHGIFRSSRGQEIRIEKGGKKPPVCL